MAYVIYSYPHESMKTYCFATIAATEIEAAAMCEGLNRNKHKLGAVYGYNYIDDPKGDMLEACNIIEWLHGNDLMKVIRGE